ncbi:alpha-hydroxy acid oxidase [Gordonia soli]|uniref:Putative oxidoreductase n=1 Tax=Gordonia soli NBRC 108243 TaxID=1223545 RepID=M0QFV1_9ACTN|nr:alpha-hydroxy acid oxidase [Gordonia soli]GAC67438.1 putative oxidoreductase [Gordonia soli NBRC 108243]
MDRSLIGVSPLPHHPNVYHSIDDLEAAWSSVAPRSITAYVNGGAGDDTTVGANRIALDDVSLAPRGLFDGPTDVHDVDPDLRVRVLGEELRTPLLLAPTSPQRLLHADAELAVARGAEASEVSPIVSCDSHYDFRRIASATTSQPWAQVFPYRSREVIRDLLDYCRDAGATTAAITIDASHRARRLSVNRAGYVLPPFVDYGTLRAVGILTGETPQIGWVPKVALTFDDMRWLRDATSMKLLAKGLTRAQDARRLVDMGYDGVIVSNHGGRQLDGAVAAATALPAVVDAVGSEVPVLFDSGIRSGYDVLRAIALGADAVCIGRPYLWGLGVAGEDGVRTAIGLILDELRDGLRQLGLRRVTELDRSFVHYPRSDS